MQNSIEKFKKELRSRGIICAVLCLLIIAAFILKAFIIKDSLGEIAPFKLGFLTGLGAVIALSLALISINSFRTLKNEKKLRLAFNAENDERCAAIRAKSGNPIIIYTSELMIIAGLLVKSPDASKALIIAAACQLLVSVVIKRVLNKIM